MTLGRSEAAIAVAIAAFGVSRFFLVLVIRN
jgi:hypothetical protein